MPFESAIRDFMIKLAAYNHEISLKHRNARDPDVRLALGTRMMNLEQLSSRCLNEISHQIEFEKLLKDNGISINYPDW